MTINVAWKCKGIGYLLADSVYTHEREPSESQTSMGEETRNGKLTTEEGGPKLYPLGDGAVAAGGVMEERGDRLTLESLPFTIFDPLPPGPPEMMRFSGVEASSVVAQKPMARVPRNLSTSFGVQDGACTASISRSIQPRHCIEECGNLSL